MANKFISNLTQSSNDIREKRAEFAAKDTEEVSLNVVTKERKALRDLERSIDKLSDTNRDSELSLKVAADTFDSESWVKSMLSLELQLVNQKIKTKVAEDFHKKWFGEEVEVA